MSSRILSVAALFVAAATSASSATFTLDFGTQSVPTFDDGPGNVINYGVVGNDGTSDIYGRLTALNDFVSPSPGNNGSVSGDIRVSLDRGEVAQLQLELFLDAGYTTTYTNSSSYEWSLVFYDIDGISSDHRAYGPNRNEMNYYDEVLFRTPGVVTVASDSVLSTSVTTDGLLVSAEGQNSVPGQDGLTSLTPEQEQYTAIYTVTDTSSVFFDYFVQDGAFGSSPRNLLVDGGSLTLTNPVPVELAAVPLPAGAPLLVAGVVALGWLRRRQA